MYLAAGLYDAAHDIAVLELAPDAVVRHDLKLLKELFEVFEGHPVNGWNERGKVMSLCILADGSLYMSDPCASRHSWTTQMLSSDCRKYETTSCRVTSHREKKRLSSWIS